MTGVGIGVSPAEYERVVYAGDDIGGSFGQAANALADEPKATPRGTLALILQVRECGEHRPLVLG
jgi:hypothetical protein